MWLEDLEAWPNLETLTVSGYNPDASGVLRAALRAPRLTRIDLAIDTLDDLTSLDPNPRIRHLRVTGLRQYAEAAQLSRVFPGLRRLELGLVAGGSATLDLSRLADLPDLEIELWGDGPDPGGIVGTEAFGDRLRTGRVRAVSPGRQA